MAFSYYVLIIVVSFMVQIMNEVGKGLFIPLHTLTCICMTLKLYTRVPSLLEGSVDCWVPWNRLEGVNSYLDRKSVV